MQPASVPLALLLLAAAALVGLAALQHLRPAAPLATSICLTGMAVALLAIPLGPATLRAGPAIAMEIDGLSALLVACSLLIAACDRPRPASTALTILALLAADPVTLVLTVAALLRLHRGDRPGAVRARPTLQAAIGIAALALTLLLLAWPNLSTPSFAAIHATLATNPLGPTRAALLLPAALGAVTLLARTLPTLPGTLLASGLLARLLVALPGPATPGWWGVPLLALPLAGAVLLARRAAAATDLRDIAADAAAAILALGASVLGAALLARAADLLPAAALAVAAALLLIVAATLSATLLLRVAATLEATSGTTQLAQLGGLLTRAPLTGTAALVALASLAALPLTPGFAALWLMLQALLTEVTPGTGRLAGTAILALVTAALAAAGLVQAMLAATALRVVGAVLLGTPRSPAAASVTEPRRSPRIAQAVLAVVTIVAGLCPVLPSALTQSATRQLIGLRAEGVSLWTLAPASEAPGYAAPALTVLLALAIAAAWRLGGVANAPVLITEPWRGGLAADPPSSGIEAPPLLLWPEWRRHLRTWPDALSSRNLLLALGLALAVALGWAAR